MGSDCRELMGVGNQCSQMWWIRAKEIACDVRCRVRRVDFVMSALCPVCTQHQTFSEPNGTSHLGQDRTFLGWLGQWDRATRIIEGVLRVREF